MTITLLLFFGFVLSLVTTIATLRPTAVLLRLFPDICENGECKKIVLADNSRLILNIPNSVLGCIYYIILAIGLSFSFGDILFYLTILPCVLSLYLSYRIFFVHQVFCKICISNHIVNVGLFSYFLYEVVHF